MSALHHFLSWSADMLKRHEQGNPEAEAMSAEYVVPDEQRAFDAWATSQGFDMTQHPLHYLFLDAKTAAARQAWKAAIAAERERCARVAEDYEIQKVVGEGGGMEDEWAGSVAQNIAAAIRGDAT